MTKIASRVCEKCGVTKPQSENYFRSHPTKRGRGWAKKCRQCQVDEARAKRKENPQWTQATYQNEQEAKGRDGALKDRREYHLKRKYGITIEDYEKMMEQGGGTCWICDEPPKSARLAVDHDHYTGHVRGLLCWKCNTAIGKFQDDPDKLMRAAAYLVNAADKAKARS